MTQPSDEMKVFGDAIVFQFEDQVRNGRFIDKTASGIFLGFNHDSSIKAPRRGVVQVIGDKVLDVKVGDTVLIEPLMWSDGFKVNGEQYWKTAESKILAIVE